MRLLKREALNTVLHDYATGQGAWRYFWLFLQPHHMIQGPQIPREISYRHAKWNGHFWTVHHHGTDPGRDETAPSWQLQIHRYDGHTLEFGAGWWQLVRDNKLDVGDAVGFEIGEQLRTMYMVIGEQKCQDHVCGDYPMPFMLRRDYKQMKRGASGWDFVQWLKTTDCYGQDYMTIRNQNYEPCPRLNRGRDAFEANMKSIEQQKQQSYAKHLVLRNKPKPMPIHYQHAVTDYALIDDLKKQKRWYPQR